MNNKSLTPKSHDDPSKSLDTIISEIGKLSK